MSSSAALLAQVIIAGGGPAGSTLAYRLAAAGMSVAVFEKATFPRYKTCGGGIQAKTAEILDFSIEPVVERILTKIQVTLHMGRPLVRLDDPPVYAVMRDRFDSFLADKAKEKGAHFFEDERVTDVQEGPDDVLVRTTRRLARASVVVGAEGAASVVRGTLYPRLELEADIGLEAEITVPVECLDELGETILLDWGTLPGGYAWVFPKGGHLSIGVGGPSQIRGRLRGHFRHFLAKLEEQGVIRDFSVDRVSAHRLPMVIGENRFNTPRTLLVGDSAGLIDPFTGEGLYYAVKSGQMAAAVISRSVLEEAPMLDPYTKEIAAAIASEIEYARSLMHLFNTWPGGFHAWLRRSDRLASAMARTLTGDKSYASWRHDLGMASFLWPLIDAASGRITRRKLARMAARKRPGDVLIDTGTPPF